MLLADLLDAYLSEREASPRYIESLKRTVKRARQFGLLDTSQLIPEKSVNPKSDPNTVKP